MSRRNGDGAIGYVLRKFPVLSETFVLEEILALEARGVPVHIISLARPNDPRFHPNIPKLKASIAYVPTLMEYRRLLHYSLQAAKRHRRTYLATLAYTMRQGNPQLLLRFLQAGYLVHVARKERLRHLHAHFATSATTAALLASKISGIPYSFTAHAYDIYGSGIDPKVLAKKIAGSRFVVAVSDFNRTHLQGLANGSADKLVRIYNGIDLARFSPGGVVPGQRFTILCVARLVEKKGLPILVEACRLLQERGVDFQCWIVGRGRLQGQVTALIKQWGLEDRIQLLGALTQEEVLERYWSAHLYVLPCLIGTNGDRDGLPVSIVEALACGLPVISTPVTGIPEVVRDQHNGLLVPSGDARVLADAMARVIGDSDLYRHLQSNARPSVESSFDRSLTVEALHSQFVGSP